MKKINQLIVALLALPLLASCGTLGGANSGNGSSAQQEKKEKKTASTGPSAREKVDEKPLETYTSGALERGEISGTFLIEEAMGKKAKGEDAPYIIFQPNDQLAGGKNRMYGNNGCNTINATYTYDASNRTFRISDPATTMMLCPSGTTDAEVNKALNETRYYAWEKRGSHFYLMLRDSSHETVMTLVHQDFDFLVGTWRVTQLNGRDINVADMQLVFDIAGGRLHGNTGCNVINGNLSVNPASVNSISIQNIVMSRAGCDDPRRESDMIVALEETYTAQPIGSDEAVLLDSEGKVLMQLKRIAE